MAGDSSQPFPRLIATCSPGARIDRLEKRTWRLQIPPGNARQYRLAQFDDYHHLARRTFPWHTGCAFRLAARASEGAIPGTWGFGFWNDPFSMGLLGGGGRVRWPVFPQAAWFFFASHANFLSIRDGLPGTGCLAMTYAQPGFWGRSIYLGIPMTPLLVIRPLARIARRILGRVINQDAYNVDMDPTLWHSYRLKWEKEKVVFEVDHQTAFETPISPDGPLGFVLWIDNQYAKFTPDGQLGYGFLSNPKPAWIEISDVAIEHL